MNCPWCQLSTGGQHEFGCPKYRNPVTGYICSCGEVVWETDEHDCQVTNWRPEVYIHSERVTYY